MSTNNDQSPPNLGGETFGNYLLLRLIGEGGFARVYLGQDTRDIGLAGEDRKVAIKILSASLEDQESQARFRKEAAILLKLNHPHIVRVYEYEIEKKIPYLVMKYEKGNLRTLYPRGEPVLLQTLVPHIKQIASALQYVHDEGLTHRDVKPENILVSDEDKVLLSDFGIAKQSKSISMDGAVMGTPAYMAPEQWDDKPCSASDQYSLAVVVYELLCGELPFQGSTAALAGQHKVKILPSRRLRKLGISRNVEKIIRHALSKEPENRYESVIEFANALEKAAFSRTGRVTQKFRDDRRALIIGGTAVVMGSVAAWFGWSFVSSASHNVVGTPVPSQQHKTVYTFRKHQAEVEAVAWSPNGMHIASGGFDGAIFVWSLHEPTSVRHDHQSKVLSISWFDNRYIASVSQDGELHIWDTTTGETYRKYPQDGTFLVRVAAWSVQGDLAVGIGKNAQVFDTPIPNGFVGWGDRAFTSHRDLVNALSFSPASNKVASASDDHTVRVWDSENAQSIRCYKGHEAEVLSVAWASQLDLIASGSADHTVQIWDASTGSLYDSYKHGNSELGYMPVKAVAWSPNGRYLVSGGEDNIAQVWNIDKSPRSSYNGHLASVNTVAVSPNGKYVATGSDDKTVYVWEM